MSIFTLDQFLWQMAMPTIKNKSEPSLHGVMLRLGGFHTPVSYLEAVSGSVFGHYLHLILGIPLQVETTEIQEAAHQTIH